MSQSHPLALNNGTHFRPRPLRYQSQSPSRSPARPHRPAAHDLDPLLSNLSPLSTLNALKATDTISSNEEIAPALARSIADASAFERELGVRAAFAAQEIQGWLKELSGWQWPSPRERAMGLGFLSPHGGRPTTPDVSTQHLGSILASTVHNYERRIAEIKSDLGALEIDEVKDYVLDAHAISSWMSDPSQAASQHETNNYGRMRDFTALITATVIRTLPDLANLNTLMQIWTVRITVLRLVPDFGMTLENVQVAVNEARALLRLEKWASTMTRSKLDLIKNDLEQQVASLGGMVDRMLDHLEGQEDRLPQIWIDRLEGIELGFATWVVDAQRRVAHNHGLQEAAQKRREASSPEFDLNLRDGPDEAAHRRGPPEIPWEHGTLRQLYTLPEHHGNDPAPPDAFRFPASSEFTPRIPPPPPLDTNLKLPSSGHRREISEVSVADSTFSNMTDISKAEIVDATREVLASPKVSVVQHTRSRSTDLSNMSFDQQPRIQSMPVPPAARSPANGNVLGHNRSKSHEPFGFMRNADTPPLLAAEDTMDQIQQSGMASSDLEPAYSLRGASAGTPAPLGPNPALDLGSAQLMNERSLDQNGETVGTKPPTSEMSLFEMSDSQVNHRAENDRLVPLQEEHDDEDSAQGEISPTSPLPPSSTFQNFPNLPRKSSRRETPTESPVTPIEALASVRTMGVLRNSPVSPAMHGHDPSQSREPPANGGSLESRIQDLLTTLPTNIRLASSQDSPEDAGNVSNMSSTRSTSPTPALVLSPAKKEPTARRGTGNVSEVREFHLTRPGQPRDAPPTKLFVRLVGDAQRVMVRVGGGWADLGEYLREYSLHHGNRAISDGRFEVASIPARGQLAKDAPLVTTPEMLSRSSTILTIGARSPRSSSFDWSGLPDIGQSKTRASGGVTAGTGIARIDSATLPAGTNSHTVVGPTITTSTTSHGTTTSVSHSSPRSYSSHFQTTVESPNSITTVTRTPTYSSTTTGTTSQNTTSSPQSYTPLGAAGPKSAKITGRRVATLGSTATAENDAWVEGMVGKARAVSGGTIPTTAPVTISPIPTANNNNNTTPSTSTPVSRRASANAALLLDERAASPSPGASSTKSSNVNVNSPGSPSLSRPKSRMSLGDMSGIKRVFLRRKTEKTPV